MFTREVNAGVHRHIQRRGNGTGVRPDERICIHRGGNVNHNDDLFIEVDRRMGNAWRSVRKYTLELYDRPSVPLELKFPMLTAEVLETMLYRCVT